MEIYPHQICNKFLKPYHHNQINFLYTRKSIFEKQDKG